MRVASRPPVQVPDWRDAEAYHPLLASERGGFAWEWLRRQDDYCAQALEVIARRRANSLHEEKDALGWNLHAFEDPGLPVPVARPVWTATRHSWVLPARAQRSLENEDHFDLDALSSLAKVIHTGGSDRLLLSDGFRSIRLDVTGLPLASRHVKLSYELTGIRNLDRPLLVLRRLQSLVSRRAFAASLYPSVCRARRLVALLRAFDAMHAGASQAEIAAVLLRPIDRHRWRVHSPSLRSQAQRLVQCAKRFANGAFWMLLG